MPWALGVFLLFSPSAQAFTVRALLLALSATAVVTVAEIKTYLQIAVADHDNRLEQLANGVTEIFERHTGTAFVQRTVTNVLSGSNHPGQKGGAKTLFLRPAPLVSVTSIEDALGNSVPASDYYMRLAPAMLCHVGTWPSPDGYWTVTYVAGLQADTASVHADVKLLAYQTVAAWFGRSDPMVASQGIGDLSLSYHGGRGSGAEGVLPESVKAGLLSYQAWDI